MAFEGVAKVAENLAVFANVKVFVTWLNNLNAFEASFRGYFGRLSGVNTKVEITKRRNLLLLTYLCIPGMLWSTIQYLVFYPHYKLNENLWPLGPLWFFSIQIMLLWQQQLEATKMLLMLASLKGIYAKFRGAIGHEVEERFGRIGLEHTGFWGSYVTALRRQVGLTGEYFKAQMLVSIAELVMTASGGLYLTLCTLQDGTLRENAGFVAASLLFCASHAFQLYLKVIHAEGIYNEVRR